MTASLRFVEACPQTQSSNSSSRTVLEVVVPVTSQRMASISRNKLRDATGTALGKALAKGWKLQVLK